MRTILAAAVDAALAAGAILREDFHAPPDASKTQASRVAAEALLAARMRAVCPGWGYCDGDRRVDPDEGERHRILVDALDGADAHAQGVRGGAVSIGVVLDGVPVLGVVYAFSAPDDDGDLFAWGRGCGPLLRNGRAVDGLAGNVEDPVVSRSPESHQGKAWRLAASDIVLVSWDADHSPEAYAAAVSPARFRGVPGVALPLALVAAGEGTAVVLLDRPRRWKLAAGHALLLASGGELLDEDLLPVRYEVDGSANCFGGQIEAARALACRKWALAGGGTETRLTWPVRGESIRDAGLLSRAQGCLLGQVAGDNLGAQVEFQSARQILADHPDGVRWLVDGGVWNTLAGQPTDDSELALALARSIVEGGTYEVGAAALAYGAWLRSDPFDVGGTIGRALRNFARELAEPDRPLDSGLMSRWGSGPMMSSLEGASTSARLDDRLDSSSCTAARAASTARAAASRSSQANGSLMRISPLAIFGYLMEDSELAKMARDDSALTHPHEACRDACAVFTVAAAYAIRTGAPPLDVYRRALSWAEGAACAEVVGWLRDAEHTLPDFMDHQGWVRHALQNAFYQLLHAPSLHEGVVSTVMGGGDTDTTAAIAGALLGAVHGREAIPAQWRWMVASCHPWRRTWQPRPIEYWPVDALVLAERLLLCGRSRTRQ